MFKIATAKYFSNNPIISSNSEGIEGSGFSIDSQQLTPQKCYNVTTFSYGSNTDSRLATAMSFDKLQSEMRVDVTASGKYAMFSADAEASYLRYIKDKDYSFSLNYYQSSYDTVNVQFAGSGQAALTEAGKSFYMNGNNPYFGLVCGDQYITSFQQGALLSLGINIELKSHEEKQNFQTKFSGSYGNIFSVATEIKNIASANHITGSVAIHAFQKGGEPSQLSKILGRDEEGYYASSCSLDAMDRCVKAADSMLDYAVNLFPTQISFLEEKGLTLLGTGFIKYLPIQYIGLKPPISFVTLEVQQSREQLGELLNKYSHHQEKLYEFKASYPVAWNTQSSVYEAIQELEEKVVYNINRILSLSDTAEGAIGCFDQPVECNNITKNIINGLKPIVSTDLDFMKQLQYFLPMQYLVFYKNGDGDSWAPTFHTFFDGADLHNVKALRAASITEHNIHIEGDFTMCRLGDCDGTFRVELNSEDGMHYSGTGYYTYGRPGHGTDHHNLPFTYTTNKEVVPYYQPLIDEFSNGQLDVLSFNSSGEPFTE